METNIILGTPAASVSATYSQSIRQSSLLADAITSPRAIWASASNVQVADPGGLTASQQFFATRVRLDVAGGRWAAIAFVYSGGYRSTLKSPFGTPNTARATISAALELADGSQQTTYTSTNNGGTAPFQCTFNGVTDGVLTPGSLLISDWIYPSDLGLSTFNFTDRTKLPWCRTAFSKNGSTDILGVKQNTAYNYPCNSHSAQCTSYVNAKTLIQATGVNAYNSGNDHWGANDSSGMPTCIGIIGIPLDGQKAVLWLHTSLGDGTGGPLGAGFFAGGVDPTPTQSMFNYDQCGYPSAWAQLLTNSTPVLNISTGGSSMFQQWSSDPANNWASSDTALSSSRWMMASVGQYFDYCIAQDVVNDGGGLATYQNTLYQFTSMMKGENPKIQIYGTYEPNGYVDITGTTQAYQTASDALWTLQAGMVTAGFWAGMLNMRGDGTKLYLDSGTQVTSTTTANGTTTTLIDTGQSWITNQWVNSWVSVGGVKQVISSNTPTSLTFGAMAGAVNSGTAYLILGNQTADGLHPNAFCQRSVMPGRIDTQFAAAGIVIPRFTRTQS